jgi:hypothetical protein
MPKPTATTSDLDRPGEVAFGDVAVKRCGVDWAATTEKAASRMFVEKVHCRLLQALECAGVPISNNALLVSRKPWDFRSLPIVSYAAVVLFNR